jgi:hypothetical protein
MAWSKTKEPSRKFSRPKLSKPSIRSFSRMEAKLRKQMRNARNARNRNL